MKERKKNDKKRNHNLDGKGQEIDPEGEWKSKKKIHFKSNSQNIRHQIID